MFQSIYKLFCEKSEWCPKLDSYYHMNPQSFEQNAALDVFITFNHLDVLIVRYLC